MKGLDDHYRPKTVIQETRMPPLELITVIVIDYSHLWGGSLVLGKFMKHVTAQNRFVVSVGVIVLNTPIFLGIWATDWN